LGKVLVLPANVRLDWNVIASYKHSSLFGLVISNEGKTFLTLTPGGNVIKTFFFITDGTNTLAYYGIFMSNEEKSFVVLTAGACTIKHDGPIMYEKMIDRLVC
jgi:hypothetical protein